MKIILAILVILSVQQCSSQSRLQGTWRHKEDSLSVLRFDKDMYFEIYDNETLDSGKFYRSSASCDTSYMKDTQGKNFEFLRMSDGSCYEITGISDTVLALRHTTSGRLNQYFRIRKK
jgi:hypothetical protein